MNQSNQWSRLASAEDQSVNWTRDESVGKLETRYVRRTDDYFIVYLSSQTGCAKGCSFCHLTQSAQTAFRDATRAEFVEQARTVMAHYDGVIAGGGVEARNVNFNWMARGEPLSNRHMLSGAQAILASLAEEASTRGLLPRFNISSILPREVSRTDSLAKLFGGYSPTIYYSLYSLRKDFRAKWLPSAMDPIRGLELLRRYQDDTKKIVKLHWAFIEGENDDLKTLDAIFDEVERIGLVAEFNLVRYNPYGPANGKEPSLEILERNVSHIAARLGPGGGRAKIVSRVGFDVKASCGMFVE